MINISVEHADASGSVRRLAVPISYAALLKHCGVAGLGFAPRFDRFIARLGFWARYRPFISRASISAGKFRKPPIHSYDPSLQAEFSRAVGLGLADYLAKRIYGARLTVTYEAALRRSQLPVKGKRPDLICYSPPRQFALEAKGSGVWAVPKPWMAAYKRQSKTGPLPVHFSVASAAYDLFRRIKVKFHDPVNSDGPFQAELFERLMIDYYRGLGTFVDQAELPVRRIEVAGSLYVEVSLLPTLERLGPVDIAYLSLLVPAELPAVPATSYLSEEVGTTIDDTYIDVDGVGIIYRSSVETAQG